MSYARNAYQDLLLSFVLDFYNGEKVIDIGAGTGFYSCLFPEKSIDGIEKNKELIEKHELKKKYKVLIEGDGLSYDYSEYDILLIDEFLTDPEAPELKTFLETWKEKKIFLCVQFQSKLNKKKWRRQKLGLILHQEYKDYAFFRTKNFKELDTSSPVPNLLALVMMVKDEKPRIDTSLKSVKNLVDGVIIFDTGSTDGTQDEIKRLCKKYKLPLFLKEGEFEDFSTSRNKLLDFANTLPFEYLLLLDANEEAKNGEHLIKELKRIRQVEEGKKINLFLTTYQLDNDTAGTVCFDRWGIIKNNEICRYEYPVHEILTATDKKKQLVDDRLTHTNFRIYQDRSNDKPSLERQKTYDLPIIEKELSKGFDLRFAHYKTQTLLSIDQETPETWMEVLNNSNWIIENTKDKKDYDQFYYAIYQAYTGRADALAFLKEKTELVEKAYLEAYDYSLKVGGEASPLYCLALFFKNIDIDKAIKYAHLCANQPPPTTEHFVINRYIYSHRTKLATELTKLKYKRDHTKESKYAKEGIPVEKIIKPKFRRPRKKKK